MDAIAFIALIAWFVFSAVRKKKKREAAEAAEREAAEQAGWQTAQQAQPAAKPVYSAPIEHPVPVAPKAPDFDPFFGGLAELLKEQTAATQTQPAAKPLAQPAAKPASPAAPQQRTPMQSRVQSGLSGRTTTMQSTMQSTIQSTMRHTLESSHISGHAHTESSITGVEPECPPESSHTYAAAQATAAKSADRSFRWDANDAMRGIVLSEILGKPKALQR